MPTNSIQVKTPVLANQVTAEAESNFYNAITIPAKAPVIGVMMNFSGENDSPSLEIYKVDEY